ncbi:low molecular weight phosphatase family protein [Gordonia sp. PKS22-38]|uniref:Low molecular weight phosphatase family protein n=1 Tax=Gordonia prachuapensis TaxID=3115651 RepID=A0ABU7MU29_9ACTN|nr:low molecular weight phosphatase family protein [Gordonia sp. PKS22-38]
MPDDGTRLPDVVFVCVSNRGKSVMAEGLARLDAADSLHASSAGTSAKLGASPNELSAQVLDEVGIDISAHRPRQLTDDLMRAADRVVIVGTAEVTPPDGVTVEVWDVDEPSARGIDGIDRMRLIRDELRSRIADLAVRLR